MILLDANLLLYAYDQSSKHNARAKAWLQAVVNGPEPVLLPWVTLLAFLRISTNPRALATPLLMHEAAALAQGLLEQPTITLIGPGERHWEILSRLCDEAQVRGPLVTDAHLAALAIEHGAVLCSADQDFARFQSLRWKNPLDAT